jgi:hypothetical protein
MALLFPEISVARLRVARELLLTIWRFRGCASNRIQFDGRFQVLQRRIADGLCRLSLLEVWQDQAPAFQIDGKVVEELIDKPLHVAPPKPPAIEQRNLVVNYRFPRWRVWV